MADELNSVELAAELTIAWLGNHNVRVLAEDVPAFMKAMHGTIQQLSGSADPTLNEATGSEQSAQHLPAVTVRRSLASKDHIISLIDGKPYKTLRRHLAGHGLTPEQYRERFNLKPDYPMTAPSYSEARRAMALKIGLGDKGRAARSPSRQGAVEEKAASVKRTSSRGASPKKPRQKRADRGQPIGTATAEAAPVAAARKRGRPRKSEVASA